MDEKLLKIINHYRVLPQLKYFQSEVYELNESIIQYEYESMNLLGGGNKERIANEIADVTVMLLQFKEFYHIDGKEILKIMNEKIERQLKRIENEVK